MVCIYSFRGAKWSEQRGFTMDETRREMQLDKNRVGFTITTATHELYTNRQ